jgi:hypothetical protein
MLPKVLLTSVCSPAFNGERILPHRIENYNKKRRRAFECWCGQYSPSCPVFVKIFTVHEGDGDVTYASCHTCGLSGAFSLLYSLVYIDTFPVCFNQKYYEAVKQTSYPGFHRDSGKCSALFFLYLLFN